MHKRKYDPTLQPAYLVFEYFADIAMRDAQVEKLEAFLKGGDLNLVMEMIMGSGKSKVLLPLLGLLRADGIALSMLIVPQPFFESVSQDTQTILQDGFSQQLRSLHFDRNTPFKKYHLEMIYDDLCSIRDNKECLIMTSKSVQCLLLKYVEECAICLAKEKAFTEELKIMRKILKLLSDSGYPIIDEADSVLNVLHEVCFSSGRRLNPQAEELETVSEIYALLYENEEIKKLASLESLSDKDATAPPLTEIFYHEVVKPSLAKEFIKKIQGSALFGTKIHEYAKKMTQEEARLLLYYITREEKQTLEAQKYYDELDPQIQEVIALVGEEISHLLPHTLTKRCNVKYGLDEEADGILAIPFSAANMPNRGSQHALRHITMNYTFQTYMKKGTTKTLVEDQIKRLQELAMKEIKESGGKIAIRDTEAGGRFFALQAAVNMAVEMPLFNYKPAHVEELVQKINGSPAAKRAFVSKIALPNLEIFEYKLSCNPINLIALFGRVMGFTGTLWNGMSMHHKLKPTPEVGTDAKTLLLLWKHSRNNAISIQEGSHEEMLAQLKHVNFDMLCDAGGYFIDAANKEAPNKEVSHAIKKMYNTEVVYYDSKGQQTITHADCDIPLTQSDKKPSDRATFLDQSHTTGADVPQKRDAVALVTIGRDMLLRDLLQSVWRLRGLDKSQRVRFVISKEVAGIIRQNLKLEDGHTIQFNSILKFVINNTKGQQGKDTYKALKQELANIPALILLKVLLHDNLTPETQKVALHHLKSYWIKPSAQTARESYGNLACDMPGQTVVEMDRKAALENLDMLFNMMPWLAQIGIHKEELVNEVNSIVTRLKSYVPATLPSPAREIEDDQTVETEKQSDTNVRKEMQTELESQNANQNKKYSWGLVRGTSYIECNTFQEAIKYIQSGYTSTRFVNNMSITLWENCKIPVFSIKTFIESKEADRELQELKSAFEGINLTLNALEWPNSLNYFSLVGRHRIEFEHLLITDSSVIILSQEEAQNELDNPHYYNLTLGYSDPTKKLSQSDLLKVVKVKFLNGEVDYSEPELALLSQWIKAQGNEKMERFFVDHILAGYPQKTTRLYHSTLNKLFLSLHSSVGTR